MNKLLLALLLSLVIAQVLKLIIDYFNKKGSLKSLVETGGMPSSHASVVASLCLGIYYIEGLTPLFFTALVFSSIVLRDAIGVRLTAGLTSEAVNKIIKKDKLKLSPIQYAAGHKPSQVLVGVILGLVITYIVFL